MGMGKDLLFYYIDKGSLEKNCDKCHTGGRTVGGFGVTKNHLNYSYVFIYSTLRD